MFHSRFPHSPFPILHFLLFLLLSSAPLRAELSLAPVFTSNAVLQAGQPLPVWGRSDPGARITLSFNNTTLETTAGADRLWKTTLPPQSPGGPHILDVHNSATGERLLCKDVLVGQVWIASGQSNMEWTLKALQDPSTASINDPQIRFLTIPKATSAEPLATFNATWLTATPESSPGFSAVAWYFAQHLRPILNQPVGIIVSAWGGSRAEPWTPPAALQQLPFHQALVDRIEAKRAALPQRLEAYTAQLAKWEASDKSTPRPRKPEMYPNQDTLGGLYHAMIHPLIPFAHSGFIWYQGESNATEPDEYAALMEALITSWRKAWGNDTLAFYCVQLAGFDKAATPWPPLRQAQADIRRVPHADMALALDVGNATNIHPGDKKTVGDRLSRLALSQVYKLPMVAHGPRFESARLQGPNVVVTLTHADAGLVDRNGGMLEGFEIAGADGVFYGAAAIIEGSTVSLSHPEVTKPVSARYAWSNFPPCDLASGAGLPAEPFLWQAE